MVVCVLLRSVAGVEVRGFSRWCACVRVSFIFSVVLSVVVVFCLLRFLRGCGALWYVLDVSVVFRWVSFVYWCYGSGCG